MSDETTNAEQTLSVGGTRCLVPNDLHVMTQNNRTRVAGTGSDNGRVAHAASSVGPCPLFGKHFRLQEIAITTPAA
jgi:hypothetical protein